jgi:hypothetical protein
MVLTVHRQKDADELLFTFYSKDKVPSTWDPMKVEAARKLGYKYPEKHGQYVIHDIDRHILNFRRVS